MAIGDTYEVSLVGEQAGKSPTMVISWKQLEDTTADPRAALVTAIQAVFEEFTSIWSTDFRWVLARVREPADPTVGIDIPLDIPGEGLTEALPPQSAAVIAKKSGMLGPSRNGRFYLPGLTEGYQVNGAWSEGAMTNFGLIGEALRLLEADVPETFKMVVVSRAGSLLITEVEFTVVRPFVATQRRRRALVV